MVRQCVSLGTVDGNSEPLQRQWASIWSHNAKRNGIDRLSANSETQVCQVVPCVNFDRDGFRVFRHTGVIAHPTDVVLAQPEMEKRRFPLVKIPPLRGGDF